MATFNCKYTIQIQCRYFVKNFHRIALYSTATPSFSSYLVNSLGFSQQQAAVTCSKLPINKWFEEKLGIPRDSKMFFCGMHLCCLSKENVESKCQMFKSFEWTEDQVYELMRRYPMAFWLSEENSRKRLSFCMNVLGYNPDFFASHSALFTYSLEKRMLPRYRVFLVLKEKGLLDYSFYTAIKITEPKFLKIFVEPFKEDVPGLLEIYQTSKPLLSTVIPN